MHTGVVQGEQKQMLRTKNALKKQQKNNNNFATCAIFYRVYKRLKGNQTAI